MPLANDTRRKRVENLQAKLHAAAKKSPTRRFHALYDKVVREDVLRIAWGQVKRNNGAPGIDGVSIRSIERQGVDKLLAELQKELMTGEYNPSPVRQIQIRRDRKTRTLSIPAVKDRVAQTAIKIVLEPIFEADFEDCSYGFRPKRNAKQAIQATANEISGGNRMALKCDILGFFDAVDRQILMRRLRARISDRRFLELIRKAIQAEQGIPQGGPLSPLLANIYLSQLDSQWNSGGKGIGRLIRYADDLVILTRSRAEAEWARNVLSEMLDTLKLKLHPTKTKVADLTADESLCLLGLAITATSKGTGRRKRTIIARRIAEKTMDRMRRKATTWTPNAELTARGMSVEQQIGLVLNGWREYYGTPESQPQLAELEALITKHQTQPSPRGIGGLK